MAARIPLILGTMTFGEEGKEGVRTPDLADCQRVVDVFVKYGYTEIDTGRTYAEGTAEAYLSNLDLKGAVVDTKVFPIMPGDHAPPKVRASVETSVKTLGTYKIRTLYLHRPDRGTPYEETLRAINELHKEGMFETLGLSNYPSFDVAEIVTLCKMNGWVRPTIYEGMYNAITRGIEAELVPCCRKHGLRIVTYNPLAGGFFAGKIPSPDIDLPKGERFSPYSFVGQIYRGMYFKQGYFDALNYLRPIAEKNGLRLTEIALRWLQHHSILTPSDGIIIGASNAAQLEQNCQDATKEPLPDEILKALDDAARIVQPFEPSYWQYLDIIEQEFVARMRKQGGVQ
ncbi:Aldo/keto reductase [Obba rivulosa]|uniref:Aldo/keto reductase n=1 Tax=Obba rivulosa TaxID=1052685 RepID=A0A8E2B1Y0_9APHY|nr:Aldo/keto reductase [Obba rivulosa]